MSDQPESTDEVFDITTATEDELRTREADLRDQIDALRDAPRTLETVASINELRAERNLVVEAVNTMIELTDLGDADLDGSLTVPEITIAGSDADAAEEAPAMSDETTDEGIAEGELVSAAEGVLAEAHTASADDRPVAPARTRPRVAYTAAAGQTAFAQGIDLDGEMMARAWESRRQNLRPGVDGGPVRAVVANLPAFEETPDLGIEALSRNNSLSRNDALIRESVEAFEAKRNGEPLSAHTAAICDPLDIIREIPQSGSTDTPFADLFPQRPVGRLGFQYTTASALSVAASGVATWTETDQDGIDPDDSSTWKPTVLIECATPTEVKADEITTSAVVDNSTEMSSPERVQEFMFKLAVARARQREQYLLDAFDDEAADYTLTATYGALSGLVQAVHTVLPQLLYAERLPETDYDLVLDPGYLNKVTIDLYNQGHREAQDAALDVIRRHVGLNVTVLRDFVGASSFQAVPAAGGGATALTALPSVNRVRLVPSAAFIYGATGEESTGWQTDPQLARQNRMQVFSQEWIMLAKHGSHPSAYIDITSTATGYLGGTDPMP